MAMHEGHWWQEFRYDTRRWFDGLNLLIGLWLIASPWVFGLAASGTAPAWNVWIVGAIAAVAAAAALVRFQVWEEWVNVALGVWLLASPWMLGYGGGAFVWNQVVAGVIMAGFALLAMSGRRKVTA